MVKRILLSVAFALFSLFCFAFPLQPLRAGLPEDLSYQASLDWLQSNRALVEVWTEKWNASITREAVVSKVESTLKMTEGFLKSSPSIAELLLLQMLLEHYLYNLNVTTYHDAIIAQAQSFSANYPSDYRGGWLLATHLYRAALAQKSMEVFDSLLERYPQESLSAEFWDDYAEAAYFNIMPSHALFALKAAARVRGQPAVPDGTLSSAVRRMFLAPELAKVIAGKEVYQFAPRAEWWGLSSRLFGLWLPMGKDWKVSVGDCKEAKSYISFGLGPLKGKGDREITYSIALMSSANNKMSFEQFSKQSLLKEATLREVPHLLKGIAGRSFEWRNPSLYAEAGGGHGLIVYAKRSEPLAPGFALEWPSPPESNQAADGQTHYYRYNQLYTRFSGEIYYAIILDSCEDIYKSATDEFKLFLSGLILE